MRSLLFSLFLFYRASCQSQPQSFSQRVNELFFGVDVSNRTASLIDSFRSISQLQYHHNNTAQWNLNTSIEMKSDNALSTDHRFTFTQSPLRDIEFEKGAIDIKLGESDSTTRILNLIWRLEFKDRASAKEGFNKLKLWFEKVATQKEFGKDEVEGEMAHFLSNRPEDKSLRSVNIYLLDL